MKKISQNLILIFAALQLMVSCGGSSGDLVGLGNMLPEYTTSKLLKKVKITETGSTPYDVNYLYAANKLSSVTTSDNSLSYNVVYNGNQISKFTRTSVELTQTEVVTGDLVYSGTLLTTVTGTIAEDGIITADFVTEYSYNAAKPVLVKTRMFSPGTTAEIASVTSELQYVGDNISKWIGTVSTPGIPDIVITSDFSNYDNSQNPYRLLPRSFTLATFNFDLETTGPLGLSANNYQNVTIQTTGGSQSEVYTHTYDSAGFVTKSSSAGVVLDFEYQSL